MMPAELLEDAPLGLDYEWPEDVWVLKTRGPGGWWGAPLPDAFVRAFASEEALWSAFKSRMASGLVPSVAECALPRLPASLVEIVKNATDYHGFVLCDEHCNEIHRWWVR